jgi:dTDP-4-dehydrorhamnose 3,5-epimerase
MDGLMDIRSLDIPDVKLIRPRRFGDARGWFSETYRHDRLKDAGIDIDFVQDNQSFSAATGTLRGLHFQLHPHAQAKLVRVLTGRILDVAVDVRASSPTFGRHVAVELDAEAGDQLLVPVGFAHGFCTLVPDTTVFYKVSDYYAPQSDAGIRWDDPALGIAWPVKPGEATLSEKDLKLPLLKDAGTPFA